MKSPIFDLFGQPAPGEDETVSAAYWPGEQPISPAPTEGLIVIPSGRETTAVRASAGLSRFGPSSPWLPTSRLKSKPLGDEARGFAKSARALGSKGSDPQPSSDSLSPSLKWEKVRLVKTPACCQDSIAALNTSGR